MITQFVRVSGATSFRQVRRACDKHPTNCAYLAANIRRIGKKSNSQSKINTLFNEVDVAVSQAQIAGHRRMQYHEFTQYGRNMQPTEDEWSSNCKTASRLGSLIASQLVSLLYLRDNCPRPLKITCTCVSQTNRAGRSIEQPDA
jgi:hypothetical protein